MSARLPALVLLLLAAPALAAGGDDTVEVKDEDQPAGFTPNEEAAHETWRFTGYIDVGFMKATGNGSSFRDDDTRVPIDYGVDPFAPAVNSRGDVASTALGGRFTNGFLPRSAGIGSQAGFLINTASADLRFTPRGFPLFIFARLQVMPRWYDSGDVTRVELQQAFGRLTPLSDAELAISLGRFDSVFGIEYLENEANMRVGITPSLLARYTTGHSLGAKVFYRVQLPALWSALSLNAAATNSGTRVEALVPANASLVGIPVGSARLGYELNLKELQVKAGVSGLVGLRNDQLSHTAKQLAVAADLRVQAYGLSLAGEFLYLVDEHGPLAGKYTGQGEYDLASAFDVRGAWARLAWTLPWKGEVFTGLTVYGRYDVRLGHFEGFEGVLTQRFTAGLRADFTELLAVKAEYLVNQELRGTPNVDNDVFTSSVVLTW